MMNRTGLLVLCCSVFLVGCPGDDPMPPIEDATTPTDGDGGSGTDADPDPGSTTGETDTTTAGDTLTTGDGGSTGGDDASGGEGCDVPADCDLTVGACHEVVCLDGQCMDVVLEDGIACEDGTKCTEGDLCSAGLCQTGTAVTCADDSPCTKDSCDDALGCVFAPDNSAKCDDGNDCTVGDGCLNGQCLSGLNECDEDCANGEDDNGDGAVDCLDPKCQNATVCINACSVVGTLGCDLTLDATLSGLTAGIWGCLGDPLNGPDVAWTVALESPATVTVTIEEAPEGASLMRISGTECDPAQCKDASATSLTFSATPATAAIVALDTPAGATGDIKVTVTCAACIPQCGGKQCGSDSCGGTCGSCGDKAICISGGQCVDKPPNDKCNAATFLPLDTLPKIVTGSTLAAQDDYSLTPGSGCQGSKDLGLGFGAADVAYKFTVTEAGQYVVAVDAKFNSVLYIVEDCSDLNGTCTAAATNTTSGTEKIVADFLQGHSYFVIVDGLTSGARNPYTLTVNKWPCTANCGVKTCGGDGCGANCGDCAMGLSCGAEGHCLVLSDNDTCLTATLVTDVPYSANAATSGAGDDYQTPGDVCAGGSSSPTGQGAPDLVYHFVAPEAGKYVATVIPTGSFDPVLTASTGCPVGFTDCLGGGAQPGNLAETVTLTLAAQESVYYTVDGQVPGSQGSFSFQLMQVPCETNCVAQSKICGDDGCGGVCGTCGGDQICTLSGQCADVPLNDTCDVPTVIDTLPWASPVINTAGATPDYVMPFDTCIDGPVAADEGHGPDVAFLYTSPAKQKVVFSFDTSQTFFNTYLYAVKTCADFGAACIAAQDSLVNGGESLILDLEVGETWFILVDGFATGSNGQFVLKAQEF